VDGGSVKPECGFCESVYYVVSTHISHLCVSCGARSYDEGKTWIAHARITTLRECKEEG